MVYGPGRGARIVGVDPTNDKGRAVASEYGRPMIDGTLVAWARSTRGDPRSFVLADVTQGHSWAVIANGLGGAADLTGFDLSGRARLETAGRADGREARIVAQNVDTGAASIVAEGTQTATARPSTATLWCGASRRRTPPPTE